MVSLIYSLIGMLFLVFMPGFLLTLLLFKEKSILEKIVFSICMSLSLSIIFGVFLGLDFFVQTFGGITAENILIILAGLSAVFLIAFVSKNKTKEKPKKKTKKEIKKELFLLIVILLIALFGFFWRFMLFGAAPEDAYIYASRIIENSIIHAHSLDIKVPNLGFFTGMVVNHSDFPGTSVFHVFWKSFGLNKLLLGFIVLFAFIGMTFIAARKIAGKKTALLAALIAAIGPVSIIHTTITLGNALVAYLAVLSLVIVFKEKEQEASYFAMSFLLCLATMVSYYSGTIVLAITSFGMLAGTVFLSKKLTKKAVFFAIIILLAFLFLFALTSMMKYTFKNMDAATSVIRMETPKSTVEISEESRVLTSVVLRLQALLIVLFGASFFAYNFANKTWKKEKENLYLIFAAALVGAAFWIVNMKDRVFDYFTFLAIALMGFPKKIRLYAAIILVVLLLVLVFARNFDNPYLIVPEEEREAAEWINSTLTGRVFGDQKFMSLVISSGDYNVTGMHDSDPRVKDIFYENNLTKAYTALNSTEADYFVITPRMTSKYILMLDYPQKPMTNSEIYEKCLEKVYDNKVKIYAIREKNENCSVS